MMLVERPDPPGRQVHAVYAARPAHRGRPGRRPCRGKSDGLLHLQRQLRLCTDAREGLLGEWHWRAQVAGSQSAMSEPHLTSLILSPIDLHIYQIYVVWIFLCISYVDILFVDCRWVNWFRCLEGCLCRCFVCVHVCVRVCACARVCVRMDACIREYPIVRLCECSSNSSCNIRKFAKSISASVPNSSTDQRSVVLQPTLSTWLKWTPSKLGYQNRTSGSVCGEDPKWVGCHLVSFAIKITVIFFVLTINVVVTATMLNTGHGHFSVTTSIVNSIQTTLSSRRPKHRSQSQRFC